MVKHETIGMCCTQVIAAVAEGGMDIILVEEDIGMGVHNAEVPNMGPVVALAGADEDWQGVDRVSRVKEVVKSALVGALARKV